MSRRYQAWKAECKRYTQKVLSGATPQANIEFVAVILLLLEKGQNPLLCHQHSSCSVLRRVERLRWFLQTFPHSVHLILLVLTKQSSTYPGFAFSFWRKLTKTMWSVTWALETDRRFLQEPNQWKHNNASLSPNYNFVNKSDFMHSSAHLLTCNSC